MENLDKLAKVIDKNDIAEQILPKLLTLSNDKFWRVKLAVIQFLPKLSDILGAETFKEHVEPKLEAWMEDSIYEIREKTVKAIIDLGKTLLSKEWTEAIFERKIKEY
jgi:serine/threonine-protein phosphatase 2A regulatory subunit A